MLCSHCGAAMPEDGSFCPACGTPVPEPVNAAAPEQQTPVSEEAPAVPETIDCSEESAISEEAVIPEEVAIPGEAAAPEELSKPHSKKKLVAGIVAAVAVLALVGGLLWYFLVYNTPQNRLERAIEKTEAQLREALGESERLQTLLENAKALCERREYTLSMELHSNVEQDLTAVGFGTLNSRHDFEAALHYSFEREALAAAIKYVEQISTTGSTNELPDLTDRNTEKEINLYADREQAQVQTADSDKVYTVPLSDFGKQLEQSPWKRVIAMSGVDEKVQELFPLLEINLFPDFSEKAVKAAGGKPLVRFLDSLTMEETDDTITDAPKELTVFVCKPDTEALSQADRRLGVYLMEQMFGKAFAEQGETLSAQAESIYDAFEDFRIYFGVNADGCLSAVEITFETDEATAGVVFLLEGEGNLFESFRVRVYEDGEQTEDTLSGSLLPKQDGFVLTLQGAGFGSVSLLVNDREGTLKVTQEGGLTELPYSDFMGGLGTEMLQDDEPTEVVVTYGTTEEGLWFAYEDDERTVRYVFDALQEEPKPLEGELADALQLFPGT